MIRKTSSENLLDKDKSVSTHHRNLRSVAVELYEVYGSISPEKLWKTSSQNIFSKEVLFFHLNNL